MKAIMVMFDSLNRLMLPPYGNDWVKAPNFERLAGRTVAFDTAYVGSMPCMPARRELHTGRHNFLHRGWGPLEPFDDSMPELLREHGVYAHLVTDHQHYWEDGGATYHTRYSSFELVRGQEGDPWKGEVGDPPVPAHLGQFKRQDAINRGYVRREEDQPQARTFKLGLEFIEKNKDKDGWLLQIETFDPHEPFFTPEEYQALYPHPYDGPRFDWPAYGRVDAAERPYVDHMRYMNAALISMCDRYLGRVLDAMDAHGLWDDTMLIVNTDHGFLLGEHDWWGKLFMPFYQEIAHIPLFLWDPRLRIAGERRTALVSTIDLAPTLLSFFGADIPPDMQGRSLEPVIRDDAPIRDGLLFGVHGGHVNCTDGRYVYMRAPTRADNAPLYEYTLMPTRMRSRFSMDELQTLELAPPFSFTKGAKSLKVAGRASVDAHGFGTLLYDVRQDPRQAAPLRDNALEARMIRLLKRLMAENDAPAEQYDRLGLT